MSENPGMGVMIRKLFGGNDPSALVESVGKKIKSVKVDNRKKALRFEMEDGSRFGLSDEGQSCCETRFMSCDDDLEKFEGAELRGARISPGPTTKGDYDREDSQFLIIETSAGEFTVVNHNEHNGYYGGFSIEVVS